MLVKEDPGSMQKWIVKQGNNVQYIPLSSQAALKYTSPMVILKLVVELLILAKKELAHDSLIFLVNQD